VVLAGVNGLNMLFVARTRVCSQQFGMPTLDDFYAITTRRSRDYIRALPFRKKPFQMIFPNANPLAIDLLTKTLVRPLVFCRFFLFSLNSAILSDI
jgi:hypothetical protein